MAMTATDTALERQALAWMDDPYDALGYFQHADAFGAA